VAKTLVDIDEDLLARVADQLGTTTKKDTVNAALAEVLRMRHASDHLARLRAGALEDLLDPEVMARAWR
jgi:Arc/MetJ family transcription regulator